MGREIDERVVEMRFDNQQFEKRAKTTLSTLDRLKKALDFTKSGESVEDLQKKVDRMNFEKMANGIDKLSDRFSAMGIVGMRIIENLTDSLMGTLNKAISFTTDAIVGGGIRRAQNIENAHFQLQALLKDETKVQAVMADAMESVDGTAYAYDEAAKAAAQFAASGLKAGDEMLGALKGITGVAAMTNSSFEDISRIFTTVAGNGRLMGDQLLQLSGRGLNAASTIADYFREVRGESHMTEAAIRQMTTDGEISFKTFSDAMTWAFGDSAKRANETFTGSLSNMKSALARIGAGFVSPLIEQNSDLIELFNALRIRINDVKSALVFDEQKSAISGMSKEVNVLTSTMADLVLSGDIHFATLTKTLAGTTGTEEELAEKTMRLSDAYEKVHENAGATSEMLKEFDREGVNSSKAIADYMNGVMKGSIKATDEMKIAIETITGGTEVMADDLAKLADEGKISSSIFTNAMIELARATDDGFHMANETVKGMLANVKETGNLTSETLQSFSKNGLDVTKALIRYFNGVNDGSIRASYATKLAVEEMTQGTKVYSDDIKRMAEEGIITYDVFQSAMENMYGDMRAASKQFTDFVLDTIKKITDAVYNADLTTPLQVFYYGFETVKNVLKGLLSVLEPVGNAFYNVFIKGFDSNRIIDFAAAVEELTSKFKLSEKGSKNLEDAFSGIFSVVKLLIDGLLNLLDISSVSLGPVSSLGELLLELAGGAGRALSEFTEWVRQAPIVHTAFRIIKKGFQQAASGLTNFVTNIKEYAEVVARLPISQRIIKGLGDAFEELKKVGGKALDVLGEKLKQFKNWFADIVPEKLKIDFKNLKGWVSDLDISFDRLDVSPITDGLKSIKEHMENLLNLARRNKHFDEFVTNLTEYFQRMSDQSPLENLIMLIDTLKSSLAAFFEWLGDTIKWASSSFSFGEIFGIAALVTSFYLMYKFVKSIEKVAGAISGLKNIFKDLFGVKDLLSAYQKDLRASELNKIAGAILMLATAITILSFANMEQAWQAALILGAIGSALMASSGYMINALKKSKDMNDAIFQFAKGLKKAMTNLSKAVKWVAFGGAVLSIGVSIALIAGSIISIGKMYKKDPDSFDFAIDLIAKIGLVLAGVVALGSIFGSKVTKGAKAFMQASFGVIGIAFALSLVVSSLQKLLKMEIPGDWKNRFGILMGILWQLAAISVVMGLVGKLLQSSKLISSNRHGQTVATTEAGSLGASPLIGFAILLWATVSALDRLFKMDLPDDYEKKLTILSSIFLGLVAVVAAMALASKGTEGVLKAGGTLVGLGFFMIAVVGALWMLKDLPGEDILKGVIALDAILVALGVTLAGAGKIAAKSTAPAAVIAMAATLVVIVGSLMVLSHMDFEGILKGVIGLDGVLVALAGVFRSAGKISNVEGAAAIIAGMTLMAVIGYSLDQVAKHDWKSILSAAISMGLVMKQVSKMLTSISDLDASFKWENLAVMASAAAMLGVISASLYFLSGQDWSGIIAGGIALSMVISSVTKALDKIGASEIDLEKAALFLLGTLAIIPIVGALVAMNAWAGDWATMITSAAAISLVLMAVAGAMAITIKTGANAITAANAALGFLTFIGIIMAAFTLIGALFNKFEWLEGGFQKGIDLFVMIGKGIGDFVGAIINGFTGGSLDAAAQSTSSENVDSLSNFADQLSGFMDHAVGFFDGLKNVTPEALSAVKNLGIMILELTAADLINGIGRAFGLTQGLDAFGQQLEDFAPHIVSFAAQTEGIDASSVQGAAAACECLSACAKNLPADPDSWMGKIFGKKSLADFGRELINFAPYIITFADMVKDVDADAVKGAAAACDTMSAAANNLQYDPDSLAAKIFGKKSLAQFGGELVSFGPSIVKFCEIVEGVNPEAANGAATICNVMSTCANELPSTGGLQAVIFGDKSLSEFGTELSDFSINVLGFVNRSALIKPENLDGVARLILIMSMLAEGLPNSGGIVSWFAGDNDLKDFGKSLEKFGESLSAFYQHVEKIMPNRILGVAGSVGALMGLNAEAAGNDLSHLTDFMTNLANMSDESLNTFIKNFQDKQAEVDQTVDEFMSNTSVTIQNKFKQHVAPSAINAGSGIIEKTNDGIVQKQPELLDLINESGTSAVSALKHSLPEMTLENIGSKFITDVSSGMKTEVPSLNTLTGDVANGLITTLRTGLPTDTVKAIGENVTLNVGSGILQKMDEATGSAEQVSQQITDKLNQVLNTETMSKVGENVTSGISIGLENGISGVARSALKVAKAVSDTINAKLEIESPSKLMTRSGEFIDQGLIIGMKNQREAVGAMAGGLSEEIIRPVQTAIEIISELVAQNTFDLDPTITPVVDLSDVEAGANEIADLFNKSLAVPSSYREALGAAAVFEATMRQKQVEREENRKEKEEKEPTEVIFNQYNTSPKALSRYDIYRQTNNQLQTYRRAVNTKWLNR